MAEALALVAKASSRHSLFKGVTLYKPTQKWRAQISHGGRTVTLGDYQDEDEAARVFDRAAICKYGKEAVSNFPAEDYAAEWAELQGSSIPSLLVKFKEERQQSKMRRALAGSSSSSPRLLWQQGQQHLQLQPHQPQQLQPRALQLQVPRQIKEQPEAGRRGQVPSAPASAAAARAASVDGGCPTYRPPLPARLQLKLERYDNCDPAGSPASCGGHTVPPTPSQQRLPYTQPQQLPYAQPPPLLWQQSGRCSASPFVLGAATAAAAAAAAPLPPMLMLRPHGPSECFDREPSSGSENRSPSSKRPRASKPAPAAARTGGSRSVPRLESYDATASDQSEQLHAGHGPGDDGGALRVTSPVRAVRGVTHEHGNGFAPPARPMLGLVRSASHAAPVLVRPLPSAASLPIDLLQRSLPQGNGFNRQLNGRQLPAFSGAADACTRGSSNLDDPQARAPPSRDLARARSQPVQGQGLACGVLGAAVRAAGLASPNPPMAAPKRPATAWLTNAAADCGDRWATPGGSLQLGLLGELTDRAAKRPRASSSSCSSGGGGKTGGDGVEEGCGAPGSSRPPAGRSSAVRPLDHGLAAAAGAAAGSGDDEQRNCTMAQLKQMLLALLAAREEEEQQRQQQQERQQQELQWQQWQEQERQQQEHQERQRLQEQQQQQQEKQQLAAFAEAAMALGLRPLMGSAASTLLALLAPLARGGTDGGGGGPQVHALACQPSPTLTRDAAEPGFAAAKIGLQSRCPSSQADGGGSGPARPPPRPRAQQAVLQLPPPTDVELDLNHRRAGYGNGCDTDSWAVLSSGGADGVVRVRGLPRAGPQQRLLPPQAAAGGLDLPLVRGLPSHLQEELRLLELLQHQQHQQRLHAAQPSRQLGLALAPPPYTSRRQTHEQGVFPREGGLPADATVGAGALAAGSYGGVQAGVGA